MAPGNLLQFVYFDFLIAFLSVGSTTYQASPFLFLLFLPFLHLFFSSSSPSFTSFPPLPPLPSPLFLLFLLFLPFLLLSFPPLLFFLSSPPLSRNVKKMPDLGKSVKWPIAPPVLATFLGYAKQIHARLGSKWTLWVQLLAISGCKYLITEHSCWSYSLILSEKFVICMLETNLCHS